MSVCVYTYTIQNYIGAFWFNLAIKFNSFFAAAAAFTTTSARSSALMYQRTYSILFEHEKKLDTHTDPVTFGINEMKIFHLW